VIGVLTLVEIPLQASGCAGLYGVLRFAQDDSTTYHPGL